MLADLSRRRWPLPEASAERDRRQVGCRFSAVAQSLRGRL